LKEVSYLFFKKFVSIGDGDMELEYVGLLSPNNPDKAVFKATARTVKTGLVSDVVVKFTDTYGRGRHQLLEKKSLVPKLKFCDFVVEVGMTVVMMEFVHGDHLKDDTILNSMQAEALKEAVETLHGASLVFGDLRHPNVIVCKGDQYPKPVMIVDFDWCDVESSACYLSDINMDRDTMDWHEGIEHKGIIRKEHDWHLFQQLTKKPSWEISH